MGRHPTEEQTVPITFAQSASIDVNLTLPGVVALVFGVLIFLFPKILNYLVAGYLIIIGLIQVFDITI